MPSALLTHSSFFLSKHRLWKRRWFSVVG
jgi:hypothetical protein